MYKLGIAYLGNFRAYQEKCIYNMLQLYVETFATESQIHVIIVICNNEVAG